tara:strand:- start:85319 stop:85492 length:174 start_codon:yes stop_codon:yes gene_type:complete
MLVAVNGLSIAQELTSSGYITDWWPVAYFFLNFYLHIGCVLGLALWYYLDQKKKAKK